MIGLKLKRPQGDGRRLVRNQPVHLVFGAEKRDENGNLVKDADAIEIGYWSYLCDPAYSDFTPRAEVDAAANIALDMAKIKGAAGVIGKLIPDERVKEFIDGAKELLPSGEVGVSVRIYSEKIKELCPNSKTCARLIGYKLFLELTANARGSYGVITGQAHFTVRVPLSTDLHECECPAEEEQSDGTQQVRDGALVLPLNPPEPIGVNPANAVSAPAELRVARKTALYLPHPEEALDLDRYVYVLTEDVATGRVKILNRVEVSALETAEPAVEVMPIVAIRRGARERGC